jgi:predicted transcriptional regulator
LPISPAQIRGALGLLDWTGSDLAERAEVSKNTITKAITGGDVLPVTSSHLQHVLEEGGVEFIDDGVRLKRHPKRRR